MERPGLLLLGTARSKSNPSTRRCLEEPVDSLRFDKQRVLSLPKELRLPKKSRWH